MSDMNGNPHYEMTSQWVSKQMTELEVALMHAHATLALAYEQRTANIQRERDSLVAWDAHPDQALSIRGRLDLESLENQITTRLGLNEGATK